MILSVIDERVLASLCELDNDGDDDVLGELIDLFLEDAPVRLSRLKESVDQHDPNGLMQAAHSLKGSCGNLGARGMAALCANLELRARAGMLTGVEETCATLEREFAAVRDELHVVRERYRDPAMRAAAVQRAASA